MQVAFGARCGHFSQALKRQANSLLSYRHWTKFGPVKDPLRKYHKKGSPRNNRRPFISDEVSRHTRRTSVSEEASTRRPSTSATTAPKSRPQLTLSTSNPPAGYNKLVYPSVQQSRFDFEQERQRRFMQSHVVAQETKTLEKEHATRLGEIMSQERTTNPAAIFGILAGWLLRHQARNFGYAIAPDGFVRVSDVLRFRAFSGYTVAGLARLVRDDAKNRFEMTQMPDLDEGVIKEVWWVRARHKHSIPGVSGNNKRVLHLGKMRTLEYRTQPENWDYIRKHGIPEGHECTIRLYNPLANKLFEETIPQRQTLLCITVDAEIAARMGVMFYHTSDVRTYAVGTRDKSVIPIEACKSAVIMDFSKETLR